MNSPTHFLDIVSVLLEVPSKDLNRADFESYEVFSNDVLEKSCWYPVLSMYSPVYLYDMQNLVGRLSASLSADTPFCRDDLIERFLSHQPQWTAGLTHFLENGHTSWLDDLIDTALTLLLCLPVGPDVPLVTSKGKPMSVIAAPWNEGTAFQEFVASQFPEPMQQDYDGEETLSISLLKAVVLERGFGIRVEWTHDFREHLSFDYALCILRIFALRYYITKLSERKTPVLPKRLIDEYNRTMDILFPSSDSQTRKFLAKRRPDLVTSISPVSAAPMSTTLNLGDFPYYHEKLADLNGYVLSSQPRRLTQFWRQRRLPNGLNAALGRRDEGPPPVDLGLLPRRFSGSTLALSMRTYGGLNDEDADAESTDEWHRVPVDESQSPSADSVMRDPAQQLLRDRDSLPTIVE